MKKWIIPAILFLTLLGITAWMTSLGSVGIFRMAPAGRVLTATWKHLQLVLAAEILAILVGVPIGFMLTRRSFRAVGPIIMGIVNIGQTVPTLALIGIVTLLLGMGFTAALVGLFIYALLPIVRNTYAGILSVDPAIKEASLGMGMTKSQVTLRVELPLARPVLIAGIRTSTVVNVGTAAVAGMIGAGGLGELIMTGLAVRVTEMILQGAAPAAALAIALDALLGGVEARMTPRGLRRTSTSTKRQRETRSVLADGSL